MEDRQKLQEMLERYRTILRMTVDPQAIAALEQLIRETHARLDELDPVDERIDRQAGTASESRRVRPPRPAPLFRYHRR